MATFTITTNQNIDALTGKAGTDIYNINGGTLTIDQDSRYGLNQTTSSSLGNIVLSATLGGTLNIDGRYVRLIPFNNGTGNVPAANTVISQGSASGKLIGVWSSLTSAPTAVGAAMPTSGFIKIKQWNSINFGSGALTGIGASATGVDVVGWLDIVGTESSTLTANRLGNCIIQGDWYYLGTTSGASNQTLQIPNSGLSRYAAGVFIETAVGSNTYEFWPNAGTVTTIGTDSTRGKVVWIDATGLVRIGNSGAATNGYTPVSGLKVVIGNVFLENCTTTTLTANTIPNATVATRYDFTTTGGGVITMSKVNSAWYMSFSQPYSISLTDVGTIDAMLLSECASPINWNRVGVGNKPTTALLANPLTMTLCFAGGTLTDCVWTRVSHSASGVYTNVLTDISGFEFINDTIRANTIRGNATTGSLNGTRINNCKWTNPKILQGQMLFITSSKITIDNPTYVDCISGTTVTTYASYVAQFGSGCSDFIISGLSLPVTNTHPYTALFLIAAAGCSNIKIRNIGTRVSPLNLGSSNACGLIYQLATGAAANNIKLQRVYCSNTRTGVMTGDNSSKNVVEENVYGDYADAADVSAVINLTRKGRGTGLAYTAQTSVYGTHWVDHFTSATVGRIVILANEPTSETQNQVTLSNGAAFTSAGGLYMPTIGHEAIFETPYYILGHTSFQNAAAVMAGGTIGNYSLTYQIDKNDGNGYNGTWIGLTGANLSAISGIDPSKGFKLKIKIVTSTTNTTAITSLYILTNSTAAAQDYQYPLDTASVNITGLVSGSEIHAYLGTDPETVVELAATESSNTSFNFLQSSGGNPGYITIIKPGYKFMRIDLTYSSTDQGILVSQVVDRDYYNPA